MTTVLISGADGFIAQHAAANLNALGCRMIGVSIEKKEIDYFHSVYEGYLTSRLKDVFQHEDIDVFIHCANHSGGNEFRINVEGTQCWAEQAKENGVNTQIFISSLSARKDSASSYGQAKFEIENWFVSHNQFVCRFGLVTGQGGLFRRMTSQVKKNLLLPLPDAGRIWVYVTDIGHVCQVLENFVKNENYLERGTVYNFFQPSPVALKSLLLEIRKQQRSFCLFLPVPSGLLLFALGVFEALPFSKSNFSRNNILGMLQNSRLDVHSDFSQFGFFESSLEDMVGRALHAVDGITDIQPD